MQKGVRRTLLQTVAIALGMFAFGYALVPLYDVFCDITGLNGKLDKQATQIRHAPRVQQDRTVWVEFVANVHVDAPWQLRPETSRMAVQPGRFYTTHYIATNLSQQQIIGQAIPSVAPGLANQYFQKIECFCFSRQSFNQGEQRNMPVIFRLAPDLPDDVHTVTLSYTFFRALDQS